MRESFVQELIEIARVNPNVVLITGDLGYGVLEPFKAEFPERYFNTGISEQSMMGFAAGLASTGKHVFVYSIGNFPTLRCLEQIRNDVCQMAHSVCIVSVGAGYSYGAQGYSHHALEDIACMRVMPNMRVLVPADPLETRHSLRSIIEKSGPSYLRLGKSKERILHEGQDLGDISRPIKIQKGADGTILFCGSIGQIALSAVNSLREIDIDVNLYSVPDMKSISDDFLETLIISGPILTLEEHYKFGGFGSYLLERFSDLDLRPHIRILGASRENPTIIGDQDFLRTLNGLSTEAIVNYFKDVVASR